MLRRLRDVLINFPFSIRRNDLPIAPVKRGIKAVLLNDMEMLKDVINDTENVYTVCISLEEFSKESTSGQELCALFPDID